ncbi:MAG: AAA family ATPase [Actinobacteria bacterium]|nr:AAA family ATPase [Actinomycetota bacterium]
MRLERLHLPDFKNLKDLSVDFAEDEDISVLVGRNGAGKSNVLEALTEIFRDLDLGRSPEFAYQLSYVCRGQRIEIDTDPARRTRRTRVLVDGSSVPAKDLTGGDPGERVLLPSFVFGYYSGPTARLETHFRDHQRRFSRSLRSGEDASRRLFYARPVHSQFALLSFFLHRNEEMLRFLREELWIEDLESVLFVMRQPSWSSDAGDERFWNAQGTVRSLLSSLYALAVAPMRRVQHVPAELGSGSNLEHLYLFLESPSKLNELADAYADERSFFKALESTYISELLREVRIRVRARHVSGAITFREMSEGEQQLLMVLGLLRFTREDEALFLLDEPDTHLNPAWSQKYLRLLRDVGGMGGASHVVLATHDPLVVSSLTKEQVQILSRDEQGQISASQPREDPRGMGVAGLLTSDVYGLRSQLDSYTLELLDEQRRLAARSQLSKQERESLRHLTTAVDGLGFGRATRDPDYEQFLIAMASWRDQRGLTGSTLTPEQKLREEEAAAAIVAAIRKESTAR